jgi:hypothetical protein
MAVIIDGDLGVDKIKDGVVTSDDLSSTLDLSSKTITLATDAVDQLSTASGSAPSYSARAWVNFNGTGTVAIRESGNVSSITDNGTGEYTVNFTTAMPDVNYSVSTGVSGYIRHISIDKTVYSTSAFNVQTFSNTDAKADAIDIFISIFR